MLKQYLDILGNTFIYFLAESRSLSCKNIKLFFLLKSYRHREIARNTNVDSGELLLPARKESGI